GGRKPVGLAAASASLGHPMKLPHDIGPVHFVGIGGIGMSGIAEVMLNLGYMVQGSDQAESANVKRLREKGVHVAIGHNAANLSGVKVLVVSSTPAGSIRRSSTAASSTPTAPMPVSAPVSGWWSRPTNPTARFSSCRPT